MRHQLADASFLGCSTFLLLQSTSTPFFACFALSATTAYVYACAESNNWRTKSLFLFFISGLLIFIPHLNHLVLLLTSIFFASYFLLPNGSTRQIPILKNLIIAAVWSSLLLLFHWNIFFAFTIFLLVFTLSVVIDWGDMENDPFQTIPKLLNTRHTLELTLVLSIVPIAFLKQNIAFAIIPAIVLFQWYLTYKKQRILREFPLFCFALAYWFCEKV
jgi:hypothetical protein